MFCRSPTYIAKLFTFQSLSVIIHGNFISYDYSLEENRTCIRTPRLNMSIKKNTKKERGNDRIREKIWFKSSNNYYV